jgi:Rab guanine nucleotide exchange factor SEC2
MNALPYMYLATPAPPSHSRSISLGPTPGSASSPFFKAKSTTDLNAMAAANNALHGPRDDNMPDSSFRTIADPRTASTSDLSRTGSNSSKHPDISNEVSALSDKLVSAIEHNTSLDEQLATTKRELEASRARIAELEADTKAHEEKLSSGELLTQENANSLNNKLALELEDEKREKANVLQEKRGIEGELETLTASLFEQANKMVASANIERDKVEKKNQQLRDQIKDGEAVINSQQEQLAELKTLMQQISTDYRKDIDSPRISLAPSSPGVTRADSDLTRLMEAMNLTPVSAENPEIAPSPSTTLTHLIKPSCRTDIPAYDDFRNLVQTSHARSHNPSHAPSRAGSGSYGGLAVMGLGSMANGSNPTLSQTSQPATSKLANSPQIPGSFSPNPDQRGPQPLKDTKFFKRILAEDVEPTLRLDLSPSLSWLNRRSIISALADSSLIVEPIPEASMRLYGKYTACAVCGDSRKEGQNPRTHAMRVREGEGATKWSICKLCLEKVRGVGDLIAYVRMVREGVVKCGDTKEEEEAWEELVRMRERLFWARMAGGVIPAFLPSNKNSPAVGVTNEARDVTKSAGPTSDSKFHTPLDQSRRGSEEGENGDTTKGKDRESDDETKSEKEARLQLQQGLDESLTTFDNFKEKHASLSADGATALATSTPPMTPPRNSKRESGGGASFPKISIPKLPDNFWSNQVNTLH